jgi:lysozyme
MSDRANWWREGVPDEAVMLSHAFEGFRAAPYLCSGGVWTIGYGSTTDAAGRAVTRETPAITRDQAETMAKRDLQHAARLATRAFPGGLPARWGAVMVLLCNNMGDIRAWGRTLHRMLYDEEFHGAADQLRVYRMAAGRPVLGLRRRRWAEAAYTRGLDAHDAVSTAWRIVRTVDDWPALPTG